VANLSKTLHTDFYQNRSAFAEVMHKSILVCFYAPQCSNREVEGLLLIWSIAMIPWANG